MTIRSIKTKKKTTPKHPKIDNETQYTHNLFSQGGRNTLLNIRDSAGVGTRQMTPDRA